MTTDPPLSVSPAKRSRTVLVALALLVLAGAGLFAMGPVSRARLYARTNLLWTDHWPFPRGKYLPTRAAPFLRSTGLVTPVRYNVEPGVSFLLDPASVVDSVILVTGHFDREIWDWMAPSLPPGGVLIDVGAHIGSMSIYGAKAVGPQGRVISVEPNPGTIIRLQDNIAASGWHNVAVEPVACGASEGRLKLFLGSNINSGVASLSQANAVEHGAPGSAVEVDVVPLDRIVSRQGLDRIDVIKIDTEGAETQVLAGGRESILRFHPVIVLETIDRQLRNMGSSKADLESLLRSYGYQKTREAADGENEEWRPAGK